MDWQKKALETWHGGVLVTMKTEECEQDKL